MKKNKFVRSSKKYQNGGQLESQYGQAGSVVGSMVGSGLGMAANALLPGLGSILSPVLSQVGSAVGGTIGSKAGAGKQMQQDMNALTVNKNPYGFAFGGSLTDPEPSPLKKSNNAIISAINVQASQGKSYDDIIKAINPMLADRDKLQEDKINAEAVSPYLGDGTPEDLKRMYPGRFFKFGGALTGRSDASVYKGRLHSHGGILVNSKGVPSGKPDAEVEGEEAVVNIGGKSYIFSNRILI